MEEKILGYRLTPVITFPAHVAFFYMFSNNSTTSESLPFRIWKSSPAYIWKTNSNAIFIG
jgi:hypothetical protein